MLRTAIGLSLIVFHTVLSITTAQAQTPAGEESYAGCPPYMAGMAGSTDCPSWYARGEALFLTRDNTNRIAISSDIDFTGAPTILMTTKDLDFGYESGARFTLGRQFGCNAIELGYFGLQNFNGTTEVTSADAVLGGALYSPFSNFTPFAIVPPFDGADLHRITYGSNPHSAEIDFRHRMYPSECLSASWLIGLRYMQVREDFAFHSEVNDWFGYGFAQGTYGIQTQNNLIGAQLGGDVLWNCTQRFSLGATGKAALLGNSATQSNYRDVSLPPPASNYISEASGSDTTLASIVEVGLFATFQVTPHFELRGGYDVILVSGLALAPDQLSFTNDPGAVSSINVNGKTVYHGPSAGMTFSW